MNQKGQINVLRDTLNQLATINLTLVQALTPTLELEYGKETAWVMIDQMGAQLREILQQINTMEPSTTVKVIPAKVQFKTRRKS